MKKSIRYFLLLLPVVGLLNANAKEPGKIKQDNSSIQILQNKGQVTDQYGNPRTDIDFKIEYGGVTMFGGKGKVSYQWTKTPPAPLKGRDVLSDVSGTNSPFEGGSPAHRGTGDVRSTEIYRLDVTLVGTNHNPEVVFEEATGYSENYYLPQCPDGATARGYKKITYKNIYPSIDFIIYTPPAPLKGREVSGIKYDFVVRPGGNPADIRIQYEGATELKIKDGALLATTPFGTITENAPYTYMAEGKQEVSSKYILEGNILRFDIGKYDGTLVIDPVLKWGTYYGNGAESGNENTYSGCVATDTNNNAIICAITASTNNIATTGAHQANLSGSNDWMIVKFNEQGVRLWATYYGGTRKEYLGKITTDKNNNIYCVGSVKSFGLASAGAYQTTLLYSPTVYPQKGIDTINALLVKFNSSGVRQWATYYGDTLSVGGVAVTCDSNNDVWIGGGYNGYGVSGGIALATSGAHQALPDTTTGVWGGYFAKFNTNGSRIYSSYYPGIVYDICFNDSGHYYLFGWTRLNLGIATTGAHQATPGNTGVFTDGFIAKFNNNSRLWGTYYGGNGSTGWPAVEVIYDAVLDPSGNIYIVGTTSSSTGMATTGAFQTAYGGGTAFVSDGFIAKFSPAGIRQWGSYYGGNKDEMISSISIGNEGLLYTVGFTESTNISLATSGAHNTNNTSGFMAIWRQDGTRKYGTYYGDATYYGVTAYGISCSRSDKIYFGGGAHSTAGIATTGSHQSSRVGNGNAFLTQWAMDTAVYVKKPFTDTFACTGDTLHVPFGVTSKFRSSNIFTIQLSNASGSFSAPVNLAAISTDTAGIAACYLPLSISSGSGYRIRILGTAPADTSMDNASNIRISSYPANFTASVNNTSVCTKDTLKLNSSTTTTGITYSWTGPNSFTASTANATIPKPALSATGNYYITINNSGCIAKDTFNVAINQTPQNVTAAGSGRICSDDTMQLTSSTTTGGVTYAWTGPNSYYTQNVTVPNAQLGHAGRYLVTVTLGNCSDTAGTSIIVDQSATINIAPLSGTTICVGKTGQFFGFPNNAGTNPVLQWQINGIDVPGANTISFNSNTLSNGDKIRLKVIPNTTCPGIKYSNEITMTVLPILTPSVSITADFNPPWNDNMLVIFTATPINGGAFPEYQWKRNGADVQGATAATWGTNVSQLNNKDKICVVLKSNYECPQPDTVQSNCITSEFTGVGKMVNGNNVNIYPNPVHDKLHIDGICEGSIVELYDVVGRECSITQWRNPPTSWGHGGAKITLDMSALPKGNYVLKLTDKDGNRIINKVVKE